MVDVMTTSTTMPRVVDLPTFALRLKTSGWVIFDSFVEPALINRMRADLERAREICRDVRRRNGLPADADGTLQTLHHLVGLGDSFLEMIDRYEALTPYLETYFRGKLILSAFGGSIAGQSKSEGGHAARAHGIHRDARVPRGGLPLTLSTLVMLDDFTPENGAPFLMSGSHREYPERPGEEAFYLRAERAVGRVGSILVFDSNLWYADGANTTAAARRSVTPTFCKPFIKPELDYPRALGEDRAGALSEHRRQLLGYNARTPTSLDEWYRPPEARLYRADQD
jgi:hypothetical protein